MKPLKTWIAAKLLCISTSVLAQAITFDSATGIVNIPSVKVGSDTYVNVTLKITNPASYSFMLQGATQQTPPGPAIATYDGASAILTLPSVQVGSAKYLDVTLLNTGNYNFRLQTATEQGLTANAVAARTGCSYALRASGALYSWGSDQLECLGNGADTSRRSPGSVATISDAVAISTGAYGYHALAIRANGEVWAWGYNNSGQLGDGTNQHQATPVRVSTLDPGTPALGNAIAIAVSAGEIHSLVLFSDGTVRAFGSNFYRALGDGSTENQSRPVPVVGLSDVKAIAAGRSFSMALKHDGTVWTWGQGIQGQLGRQTPGGSPSGTPAQVAGLANISAISAGDQYGLALQDNGDVWSWGVNMYGQLGDGSGVASRFTPGKVPLLGVARIAAGARHAFTVMPDGSVYAWGYNVSGELGVGDQTTRTSPVKVEVPRPIKEIAGGFFYTLAIDIDGSVWGWGSNATGELGLGSTTLRFTTPQRLP